MTAASTVALAVPARVQLVRRLALVAVGMAFLLMVLGAWVKANGAGLSCPDWPTCYGQLLPPFPDAASGGQVPGYQGTAGGDPADDYSQAQILYEWTHRAVVALIIVPVAGLYATTRRGFQEGGVLGFLRQPFQAAPGLPALAPKLANFAIGIFVLQAILGALTVVTGNPPWATTLHLATAALWFATLTLAAANLHMAPMPALEAPAQPKPKAAPGYVYKDDSA